MANTLPAHYPLHSAMAKQSHRSTAASAPGSRASEPGLTTSRYLHVPGLAYPQSLFFWRADR